MAIFPSEYHASLWGVARRIQGSPFMLRRSFILGACALTIPAFAQAQQVGTVSVLYAGSLVNLMEHGIGPAFNTATGGTFQGFAGGSNGLANQIRGQLRRGDVFISAAANVNDTLIGAVNGNWVAWYITFAQSPVVIGYSPSSRFAADLKSKPWYEVLQEPSIKIGRTDPKLDPKGALTVQLLDHAEQVYKQPGLAQKVLGAPENPDQVRPEENLVGRLQSGQIDAGFFYSTETSDLKIPSVPLPPEVALSAHYTVTILRDSANPAGAARFVAFLLGPQGRAVMQQHGLDAVKPAVTGNAEAIPSPVRSGLAAGK
jgi:molybdate/tungstate transport system substrate-binding protein